jgi:hypothetical protein
MPNPPKPIEQKRKLGNPGRRPLPDEQATIALPSGYVDPPRPLEFAGQQLWDAAFKHGGTWISSNTDVPLLLITCEQLDRREELRSALAEAGMDRQLIMSINETEKLISSNLLRSALAEAGMDRQLIMSINETEKLISSNLGLLGFSPADRTRLGLAEVKTQSKLQELMAKKNGG